VVGPLAAVGGDAGDGGAVDEDGAGAGAVDGGDGVEERRLAGAVGADDAEYLFTFYREADVG